MVKAVKLPGRIKREDVKRDEMPFHHVSRLHVSLPLLPADSPYTAACHEITYPTGLAQTILFACAQSLLYTRRPPRQADSEPSPVRM
jgi:hypothetical protein